MKRLDFWIEAGMVFFMFGAGFCLIALGVLILTALVGRTPLI